MAEASALVPRLFDTTAGAHACVARPSAVYLTLHLTTLPARAGSSSSHVLPAAPSNASCGCGASVAFLISGQLARFSYPISFADLDDGSLRSLFDSPDECRPKVDVFAVLSVASGHRSVSNYWGSSQRLNTEPANETIVHIRRHFLSRGARRVHVTLLNESTLDAWMVQLAESCATRIKRKPGAPQNMSEWRAAVHRIPNWERRWLPHGRMFLMRHLVFMEAAPAGYHWFVYMREDNRFLRPAASLTAFARNHICSEGAKGRAVVAVDELCGFGGYSDKVYLASPRGAAELFGTSFEQHAQHMAAWVSPPLRNQSQRPVNDPMQTEIFLRELLDGAGVTVHQLPFHRTDVRVVADGKGGPVSSPEFCVESHYWSCASNHTGLTKCDVSQEARR